MSLYTILADWVKVVDPEDISDLSPVDQRELLADVFAEEPESLADTFSETFGRDPSARSRLTEFFRHGDLLQMGAILDREFRRHVIGSPWLEREMQDVKEKETRWTGDY